MTEPQAERWTIEPFGGEIEEQRNRAGIDRNIGMVEYVGAQSGLICQFAECAAQLLHEGGRSRQCAAANPSDHRFSVGTLARKVNRSEEHTSELQSLMRISYAVFCLKKKK